MIYRTKLKLPLPTLADPYACHIRACEAVDSSRDEARMVFHSGFDGTAEPGLILFTPEPVNGESEPFLPTAPCRFLIRLNPTKRSDGKLMPLLEREEIVAFVRRKLSPFNVDPETLLISQRFETRFRKKGGHTVTINTVLVRGEILELPEDFENLVLQGVGREKAFGFGTLLLLEKETKR